MEKKLPERFRLTKQRRASLVLLRRHVFPACDALGIPRATYLTFRRTFSTWSHYNGVPLKDLAALMGHSEVKMQFTYIQAVDAAKRVAAERIGEQLVTVGHKSEEK